MPYNPFGYQGFANNIQSVPGTADINGVPQVSSIDEVRAANVPYGVSLFFSKNDDGLFYAKNSQGMIKCFKYEEISIPSNDPQNFVTRQEFDELRSKYEQLVEQHAAQQPATTIQPQPIATYASNAELQGNSAASTAGVLQSDSGNGFDQISAEQPVG